MTRHENPIMVDERTGSDRLGQALRIKRQPVEITRLEYGDACFLGNGPDGRPIPVGVEYKIVTDVLKCICDGRFAGHQLPGLVANYEVIVLLVEGQTRPAKDGTLEIRSDRGFWYTGKVGNRGFMYREFDHWLATMAFKAGVRITRTVSFEESVQALIDLYGWWVDKEWSDHRSHLALTDQLQERATIIRPGLVRRVAKELPGLGWQRSSIASKRFRTVADMVMADAGEWSKLEGIGKKTAEAIVDAIWNGNGKKL